MAFLFDLPETRNNKEADKRVVNKTTNKRSASTVIKGGGMFEKIATMKALVENKLGKYKDDYIYFMAEDEQKFKDYIYAIKEAGNCSIDTETTGLDPLRDTIVGLSLYTKGQKGLYIPLHHKSYISGVEVEGQLDPKLVSEQLKLLVDNSTKFKYYNAKFDIRVLKNNLGVYVPAWFDAHLAAMCLNENEPHGLKNLHSKYVLGGKEDEFSFGKLFDDITFDNVPIQTGYIYAARDAVDTDELVDFQLPFLTKDNPLCIEQGLEKVCDVFWNIEMPCIEVLADMEDSGITLDIDYAKQLSEKYHKIKEDNLNEFYRILDMYKEEIDDYKRKYPNNKLSDPISVSSPTQLAILFYDILKIPPVDDRSPRGTGVEILEKIDNPLCKAILDYRATDKLLSTYIDKLPECVYSDGKIHCSLNQYGAKTGRMSSDNPNMQNIPSHNKDIRKMFVASKGNVLLSSDYSQQEPKVCATLSGDPVLIQSFIDGKDVYSSIASVSFNKNYEDCREFRPDGTTNPEGKDLRQQAKSIFLGIIYDRGAKSIAEQLHTTKQKAEVIQSRVFKSFPALKQLREDTLNMAETYGFVTTLWGRKRRLPDMQLPEFEFKYKPGYGDIDPLSFDSEVGEIEVPEDVQLKYIRKLRQSPYKKRGIYEEADHDGIIITDNGGKIADATRQCVNSRVQGSAADLTKLAAIEIYNNKRLKELGFKLLIPVHDEFIAECPRENAKECAELFSKCMSDAARDLPMPITTDVEISECWYGESIRLEDL